MNQKKRFKQSSTIIAISLNLLKFQKENKSRKILKRYTLSLKYKKTMLKIFIIQF